MLLLYNTFVVGIINVLQNKIERRSHSKGGYRATRFR